MTHDTFLLMKRMMKRMMTSCCFFTGFINHFRELTSQKMSITKRRTRFEIAVATKVMIVSRVHPLQKVYVDIRGGRAQYSISFMSV